MWQKLLKAKSQSTIQTQTLFLMLQNCAPATIAPDFIRLGLGLQLGFRLGLGLESGLQLNFRLDLGLGLGLGLQLGVRTG